MSREVLEQLARRTLAHAQAGTVPLAGDIARVPADRYTEPGRWQLEMDRVFRRTALVLGYSCELAEPNTYKSLEVGGVPILLIRGDDGQLRSFLNVCGHRGAIVVPEGSGKARRFTCPYHAWTYDGEGRLVGILDREEFGDVDASCRGLVPLPAAERAGIVFGALSPEAPFDIDAFLCGYDKLLEHFDFAHCTHVGAQAVDGPNWKVAYDGYLDLYHLPILHRESFGPDTSNKAIYDAWGPHQRVSSPDSRVAAREGADPSGWSISALTSGVWTIFPHASIASFRVETAGTSQSRDIAVERPAGGRMYMISTLFPGADPSSSRTYQDFLADFEVTPELEDAIEAQKQFLLHVVRDEDYFTGNRIQRALTTGMRREVLFGRNEAGGQRFHGWVDRLIASPSDEEFRDLFATAEIVFQR